MRSTHLSTQVYSALRQNGGGRSVQRGSVNVDQTDEIDELDDDDDEPIEDFVKLRKPGGKPGGKPGRKKTLWSNETLDDLIDIIINNEVYKRKLIFINTKNQKNTDVYEGIKKELQKRATQRGEEMSFSANQLRNKFKKCVAECKKAALTIKTATGIKRFCESKGFVKQGKKRKSDTTQEVLDVVKKALSQDPTAELLQFLKEEMDAQRRHEAQLFSMLTQGFLMHTLQYPHNMPSQYASVPFPTFSPSPQQASGPNIFNQGPSTSELNEEDNFVNQDRETPPSFLFTTKKMSRH
ncbi:hypothetical protein AC249_AIPGENE22604 [Exaiptasia diaphana]|nr:hypothetical protein AC249_AIPGENE22604 [Exaiptasia diaphana]